MSRVGIRRVYVGLLVCGVFAVVGCKRQSITLGPKPAIYSPGGHSADMSDTVDGMRAWLTSLSAHDAAILKRDGRITYSYQALQATDPPHAQLATDYARKYLTKYEPLYRSSGMPLPSLPPQEMSFVQTGPGAYDFYIVLSGTNIKGFTLSDPVP